VATNPVIIEAALNGATTKQRNRNVPREPSEIAEEALACLAAGAALVHNHIDLVGVSGTVAAARYLEAWEPVLAARPDALVYPTINFGAPGRPHDYNHITPLATSGLLRIGLSDPGSVTTGDTATDGPPAGSRVYANSYDDIAGHFQLCHDHHLGVSLAIMEPGFLRTVTSWWRAGRLPQGAMVKLYFCDDRYRRASFGMPPTPAALDVYQEMLDGCPLPWSVSVFGGDVVGCGLAELAVERGGHLHVGLEPYGGPGMPTNVELVDQAVAICQKVGRPVASCDEAAHLMDLPADVSP
jgi:3-keto-5-aminohexanoate cleavage enzyme